MQLFSFMYKENPQNKCYNAKRNTKRSYLFNYQFKKDMNTL